MRHKRDPRITVSDVETVVNNPAFFQGGRGYFDGVWGQAAGGASGQQDILKVMAPANRCRIIPPLGITNV